MSMRSAMWFSPLLSVPLLCSAQLSVTGPVIKAQRPVPPPAAAAAPSTPALSAAVPASYLIGADDALMVTVWKEPNLSGPLSVRPDGMISLPLVGDVPASGMTPMQLGTDLATRFKKFVNDPLVTVTVTAVNSKRVYVLGEVQHIGPLALSPGMTLLQAISAAGGLTPYANSKKIYVLRGEVGKQQKIAFNYKKAIKEGDEQGVSLAPGDTIVVP